MHMRIWLAVLALAATTAFAGGPKLTFESEVVDLGKVDPGQKVEAVFRFTNTGDAVLEIEKVKPG